LNLSLKIKNEQVLDFSIFQSDTAETRIDLQDYRVLRLGAPRGITAANAREMR